MAGPHQDNGVPVAPLATPTVTPTPVNQVSPGHPSGAYNPNLNIPPPPPPPEVNYGLGDPHGQGDYAPVYPGLGEEGGTTYNMLDIMQDLANVHGALDVDGEATKYGLSYEGKTGQLGAGHTLGSFIAVDSSGNPILDSQGKPVFTSLGKYIHDDFQDKGYIGQNQYIDPSMMGELKDMVGQLSHENLQEYERDFWRNYSSPDEDRFTPQRNILQEQRARQMELFYGPRVAKQRDMRQQGFFDTMEDPYAKDIAETLQKGLYSGTVLHPGKGVLPWGMEKIYATGRAKGGIVSLVGE